MKKDTIIGFSILGIILFAAIGIFIFNLYYSKADYKEYIIDEYFFEDVQAYNGKYVAYDLYGKLISKNASINVSINDIEISIEDSTFSMRSLILDISRKHRYEREEFYKSWGPETGCIISFYRADKCDRQTRDFYTVVNAGCCRIYGDTTAPISIGYLFFTFSPNGIKLEIHDDPEAIERYYFLPYETLR